MAEKKTRDFLANWENWPKELDVEASVHKKRSYFAISGPYDTFDNIRATLWQTRNEKRSVVTGCLWRREWTSAPSGIIPKTYGEGGFGHAFVIRGWETKGEVYLIAQLSNGKQIGESGLFYFPREVVNKEFTYGAFSFSDMPVETAKFLNERGFSASWSWLARMVLFITKLIFGPQQ